MRKLAPILLLLALALPGTALAKGPSKASIAGPGITTVEISGAEGSATPFWRFVEAAGWFEAAYGTSRLPEEPPGGDLGPRYTITWTVPSSSKLRQDVYPYARPSPLTYTPRGQRIYGSPVKGGWFAGGAKLEKALFAIGMPRQPRTTTASSAAAPKPGSSGGSSIPGAAFAVLAAAALLALARAATALRRRSSGAAGT